MLSLVGQALTQVRAKIELISCFSSELKANNHVYICLGELSRRSRCRFWRLLWFTCCRWVSLNHLLLEVHLTHSFKGGIGSLEDTIPGTPGEDYPIYAVPPETSFTCDGQVDGGYYGDPEAECQAFHICSNDGNSGLSKFSFLCPNGTLFQQQYFVCDWWFNVDCSTTEDFYGLNDEIAAERQASLQFSNPLSTVEPFRFSSFPVFH